MGRWAYAVVLASLLMLSAGDAWAKVYVYRDAAGAVRFTNAPAVPETRREPRFRLASSAWPRSRWASPAIGAVGGARREKYDEIINEAAIRHRVDSNLIKAVIRVESDFVPHAVSPKGALGLMQLMPATARMLKVRRAFDPNANVDGGARHLRYLMDRFQGNLRLVLAAYNAGEGAVARYRGIPPYAETQDYVSRVLRYRDVYVRGG